MYHPKSCHCKVCSIPSDCDLGSPDSCSNHWQKRFCKLRKQWSEHSKCGSIKHCPEDFTHSRSPPDKTVGTFGVAWVAEIPHCENDEPKGWQVEIKDTTDGIIRKSKELIEWLNNPPVHLYDEIKRNGPYQIKNSKWDHSTTNEYRIEPCIKETLYKNVDVQKPKKCRIKCANDEIIPCHFPCGTFTKKLEEHDSNCPSLHKNNLNESCDDYSKYQKERTKSYQNKYYMEPQSCDEFSDTKIPNLIKKCQSKCKNYSDHDEDTNRDDKFCTNNSCEEYFDKHVKQCKIKYCKNHPPIESFDKEKCHLQYSKCCRSTSIPKNTDGVFRKESCCCHCQEKFFKNAETSYEIDIEPQKDENSIEPIISQISELDSKIICAGVRTSQICKKLKEEKRLQLMQKYENDLNTVVANKISDEEISNSIFMSPQPENQSVIDGNLVTGSLGSRRRSNKFRRKESGSPKN